MPTYPEEAEKYAYNVTYAELDAFEAEMMVRRYNDEASMRGIQMTNAVRNFVERNFRKSRMNVNVKREQDTSSDRNRYDRADRRRDGSDRMRSPHGRSSPRRRRSSSRDRRSRGDNNKDRRDRRRSRTRSRSRERRDRRRDRSRSRDRRPPIRETMPDKKPNPWLAGNPPQFTSQPGNVFSHTSSSSFTSNTIATNNFENSGAIKAESSSGYSGANNSHVKDTLTQGGWQSRTEDIENLQTKLQTPVGRVSNFEYKSESKPENAEQINNPKIGGYSGNYGGYQGYTDSPQSQQQQYSSLHQHEKTPMYQSVGLSSSYSGNKQGSHSFQSMTNQQNATWPQYGQSFGPPDQKFSSNVSSIASRNASTPSVDEAKGYRFGPPDQKFSSNVSSVASRNATTTSVDEAKGYMTNPNVQSQFGMMGNPQVVGNSSYNVQSHSLKSTSGAMQKFNYPTSNVPGKEEPTVNDFKALSQYLDSYQKKLGQQQGGRGSNQF